jgi:hypothetical protein
MAKKGILKGQFKRFCKEMKMAKADVTAPAMHTILHDKKGVLKEQFQKIL